MIEIGNAQLWVHDQDEALAFYTEKVGFEVRADVTMDEWGFRWVNVGPVGGAGSGLVLMPVPGPPMLDQQSSAQLSELVAKGGGGTVFLTTEDCQGAYEELMARGVEFTEAPTPQPYGIDCGFRDPSGNSLRLTQVMEFSLDRH